MCCEIMILQNHPRLFPFQRLVYKFERKRLCASYCNTLVERAVPKGKTGEILFLYCRHIVGAVVPQRLPLLSVRDSVLSGVRFSVGGCCRGHGAGACDCDRLQFYQKAVIGHEDLFRGGIAVDQLYSGDCLLGNGVFPGNLRRDSGEIPPLQQLLSGLFCRKNGIVSNFMGQVAARAADKPELSLVIAIKGQVAEIPAQDLLEETS